MQTKKKRNIKDNEIVKDLHRLTCTLQINLDKYDKQQQQMNITGAFFFLPIKQIKTTTTTYSNRSHQFK